MLLDLNHQAKRQVISLTPLIDVVFILLLFFMLSSSFMTWRQLDLISPSTAETLNKEPIVRVLNLESNKGVIRFEGQSLNMHDKQQLEKLIEGQLEATYVLTVNAGVNVQAMVTLLDNLKALGAKHVSLSEVLP